MKRAIRNSITLLALALLMFTAAGCGSKTNETSDNVNNPIATITMDNDKVIKVELYPSVAPNTVNNFISLANSGFYDGLIFHRVIKDFMIQGGDPLGNGTGGPNYEIPGEFTANGFANDLKHTEGVISMARSQNYNSGGSQFFIMCVSYPSLDGQYAAFGKVTEGIDVVHEIENIQVNYDDKPIIIQKIKSIKVETFGVEYPNPKKS